MNRDPLAPCKFPLSLVMYLFPFSSIPIHLSSLPIKQLFYSGSWVAFRTYFLRAAYIGPCVLLIFVSGVVCGFLLLPGVLTILLVSSRAVHRSDPFPLTGALDFQRASTWCSASLVLKLDAWPLLQSTLHWACPQAARDRPAPQVCTCCLAPCSSTTLGILPLSIR